MGRAGRLKKLLQSPFTMHKSMIEFIDREAENAKRKKTAHIIAKMNSLVEPQIIQALYRASQAGVKIDLIVRGVCSLRPGVKGFSDNIKVRSVIGRFLEHTRIFYFENDGDTLLYLSSADWMGRNFFNRVETCFPVEDEELKRRIVREGLQNYRTDNCQAWLLQSDGGYKPVKSQGRRKSAQDILLATLADES